MMLSIIGRPAVVLAQQIDQQSALVARQTRAKRDFSGNTIQIMDEQNGIVAPVIANGENHRWAGESEHQTISKLKAPAVAVEHGGEPSANPTVIELHLFFGTKTIEHALSLLVSQSA